MCSIFGHGCRGCSFAKDFWDDDLWHVDDLWNVNCFEAVSQSNDLLVLLSGSSNKTENRGFDEVCEADI